MWLHAEDDSGSLSIEPKAGLKIYGLPSLQWMLDSEKQERYPYDKTYEEAKWDDFVIIHTSGTTGKLFYSIMAIASLPPCRLAQADRPYQRPVEHVEKLSYPQSPILAPGPHL